MRVCLDVKPGWRHRASDAGVQRLELAKAEGRAEMLAYSREVGVLCAKANQHSRTLAFIEAGTPVTEVRAALFGRTQ